MEGYSSFIKTSQYLKGFDGTKLAADIIKPVDENGKIIDAKLPVILVASRGGRWQNGELERQLITKGYVYVIVEMRGCGASFGVNDSFASMENRKDIVALIKWIMAEPWCDGNLGMMGGSNRGFIQLAAATMAPEGLKAITPSVSNIDFYYQNYPNGVSALPSGLLSGFTSAAKKTKEEFLKSVTPVDEDLNGDMAYEAYEKDQFPNNKNFVGNLLLPNMYRDSSNPNFEGSKTNIEIPPVTNTAAFIKSGIKLYQLGGWFDSNVLGQLIGQKSWGGLLTIGPWDHFECCNGCKTQDEKFSNADIDLAGEYERWFDFTLKNKDNGMDQRPPIYYYTLNAKPKQEWRYAENWPVHTAVNAKLYFDGGKSGTVSSANDGTLSQIKPESLEKDIYKVDTSIKVFENENGKDAAFDRMKRKWNGDMSSCVDKKGLTYTSAPLFPVYENEITGTPSVELWVTSNAPYGDFLVYLEEIRSDGSSKFITEGEIRASHRSSEANESWDAIGATYHPSLEEECRKLLNEGLSKEPVLLSFALEPTSYVFEKGSRIRVTVTCADKKTFQHPMYEDFLPTVEIYRGDDRASSITLPFVEHVENVFNGTATIGSYEGPATLYIFKQKFYLNYNGVWKSWNMDSPEADYEVIKGIAVFKNAGFTFRPEGVPIKDGIAQNYKGDLKMTQPFPAKWHVHLATVPTEIRTETLFVPTQKNLYIDLFMPESNQRKAPCVIYIHGYGGSPSALDNQLKKLLDNGFAVAGIDLRNYPPNYAPDHIHDIKGSVRFLRANAEKYGIDPDKIGVYGYSLGGNMGLMLAVSGDDVTFEGTVGGNLGYSSRIQAAVSGFAWSDLLYMGYDLANEYNYDPVLRAEKLLVSDGEFSPSSEIIGFTGKGKGIGVLRAYIEAGEEGNELLERKIREAKMCSPLYHIKPDAAPIALFHGLGMTRVHIPNNQSYRTFEALSRNDVKAFMFSNTMGEYGEAPEIQEAVLTFFKNYLMKAPDGLKLVLKAGSKIAVVDYLSREMEAEAFLREGHIMIPVSFIEEVFCGAVKWDQTKLILSVLNGETEIDLKLNGRLEGKDSPLILLDGKVYGDIREIAELLGATLKWYDSWNMLTVTKN